MKIQSTSLRRRAFTLIELMVTITIIAMLASLAIFAMRQALVSANRKKTQAYMEQIKASLLKYQLDNGAYPRPKEGSESSTVDIAGTTYPMGGATTLYQALTGDGDDAIEGGSVASSGQPGSVDGATVYWADAAPGGAQRISIEQDGKYFIADGFGVPFQYRVPPLDDVVKDEKKEDDTTVYHNPNTYDLWSYGGDYGNENSWITNW